VRAAAWPGVVLAPGDQQAQAPPGPRRPRDRAVKQPTVTRHSTRDAALRVLLARHSPSPIPLPQRGRGDPEAQSPTRKPEEPLKETDGVQVMAGARLGITPRHLTYKMQKHRIIRQFRIED